MFSTSTSNDPCKFTSDSEDDTCNADISKIHTPRSAAHFLTLHTIRSSLTLRAYYSAPYKAEYSLPAFFRYVLKRQRGKFHHTAEIGSFLAHGANIIGAEVKFSRGTLMEEKITDTYPVTKSDTSEPSLPKSAKTAESGSFSYGTEPIVEKRLGRRKIAARALCLILAAVGSAVFISGGAQIALRLKTPVPMLMLREVLGVDVKKLGGSVTLPPLAKIPPQTVYDGAPPGASELESISEDSLDVDSDETILPIRTVDLSASEDSLFELINETPYDPDTLELVSHEREHPSKASIEEKYGEGAPCVLVLHTHGTEAYSADGAAEYLSTDTFRTHDPDESVVAVGRAFSAELTAKGISVIHSETMFDRDDYNSAYTLASDEIRNYLKKYPSISYVFDIHRDAMVTSEGVNLRPLSSSGNAQIMLVVGTDYAGSGHTGWQKNLTFALLLQQKAAYRENDLMRAINLRSASFNEQYTPQSLLLEIGTAANSLAEAERAARSLASAAAELILGS